MLCNMFYTTLYNMLRNIVQHVIYHYTYFVFVPGTRPFDLRWTIKLHCRTSSLRKIGSFLDIHLLKAQPERQAVAVTWPANGGCHGCCCSLVGHIMTHIQILHCSAALSILRWLPLKLAGWPAEITREELAMPARQGAQYTVTHLNSILANDPVPKFSPTGMGGIQGPSLL
jgi:hypothetical protein